MEKQFNQQVEISELINDVNETLFCNVVDSIQEVVTIYDPELRILHVNHCGLELSGRPLSDFLGKREDEIWPKDVYEQFLPRLREAAVTKTKQSFEMSLTLPNGHSISQSVIYQPLLDGKGNLQHIIGLTIDITERKKRESNTLFLLELDSILREITDADCIMRETTKRLGDYLNVARCGITEVHEDSGQVVILHNWCCGAANIAGTYLMSDFINANFREILKKGEPIVIENVRTNAYTLPYTESYTRVDVAAFITVPCYSEGHWRGMLDVHSNEPRDWLDDEINLLKKVAARIWPRIENARLIKALRQSEDVARQQLAEIESIYNSAHVGLCVFDRQLRFIRINERMAEINGVSAAEHIGRVPREIVPDLAEAAEQLAARIFDTGEPILNIELSGTTPAQPDVTRHWIEHWLPLKNKQGWVEGINVIVQDITELKKAKLELKKKVAERTSELTLANERYRFLIDNTPDMIFTFDREFRYTFVNQSVCRVNGLAEDEILGETHRDLGYPENTVRELEELFYQALKGNNVEKEIATHMPDGIVRTFWLLAAPLFDESGNITGVTGTGRDITERKIVEEEILKMDKLESIGLLAGGIAHDYNNLMTAVLGNISLALRDINKEDKNYKRLKNVEKAVQQAKDLTRQLQTFAMGGEPIKTTISIKKLLRRVIPFYLSGSNVKCNYYFPKNLSYLDVDEGQITQVIENLVINAIQAMPDGGTIHVSAEKVIFEKGKNNDCKCFIKDGLYVKIKVQDRGVGIDAKDLKKVFDPFFTTKEEGSGLGLAVSHSIIKKHGGCIKVESEPGVGTTFSIYLPSSSEKALTKGKNKNNIVKGSGRILVMDDQKAIRDVLGDMLQALGYQVDFAIHGEEAIEKYKKMMELNKPYDVVMLDLTIPGKMGGKQAMSILKNLDPEVNAIISTGYSEDLVELNCKDFGFKGFIKKPYDLEQLSETLDRVLAIKPPSL